MHLYFFNVFDRSDVPVDVSVLDEIEYLPMDGYVQIRLESLPDRDEVTK
jgi:hypothetical protein